MECRGGICTGGSTDPYFLSYDPAMPRQPDIPFSAASFRHTPVTQALALVLSQLATGCTNPLSYPRKFPEPGMSQRSSGIVRWIYRSWAPFNFLVPVPTIAKPQTNRQTSLQSGSEWSAEDRIAQASPVKIQSSSIVQIGPTEQSRLLEPTRPGLVGLVQLRHIICTSPD